MKKKILTMIMTAIASISLFAFTNGNNANSTIPAGVKKELTENVSYSVPGSLMEEETIKPLELEAWMTDGIYFSRLGKKIVEETEKPLKLEKWMVTRSYFQLIQNDDKPLDLENWRNAGH